MPHREQYIEGLRQFADFLVANPDYPATREHYVIASSDAEGASEVYRLAVMLGADVQAPGRSSEHWRASRKFAGLCVEIVYVSRKSAEDWKALTSYGPNLRAVSS